MDEKNSFIGKQIGSYQVEREISNGAFGSVYQAHLAPTRSKPQGSAKKPNLEAMHFIDGGEILQDGSTLRSGYCLWIGTSRMYLGKLVDGEYLRYGDQGWRWYAERDNWKAVREWLEEVNSARFITQYGSNNPPLEKNRVYEPMVGTNKQATTKRTPKTDSRLDTAKTHAKLLINSA